MIAVVSILCVTSVVLYAMRLWEVRVRASTNAALERLTKRYDEVLSSQHTTWTIVSNATSTVENTRSDLATVSGRLSDLQQAVKDANLSRIDRQEQQIQAIHARMGAR